MTSLKLLKHSLTSSCLSPYIQYSFKCNFKLLPIIKDELYAINITNTQVSPIEGVYTISAVPTMRPPPTNVATGWINTRASHLVNKQQLFGPFGIITDFLSHIQRALSDVIQRKIVHCIFFFLHFLWQISTLS